MQKNKEVVVPYQESELGKKKQIAQMFDNIAPRYDLLNRLLSLGIDNWWRWRAINQLKSLQPKEILDVATGTGDLALAMMRLNPDKVMGVDISEEMLAVGREKIRKRGLQEKIELRVGDAENLPFDNNSFDAVTVSFGVRNFENLEQGVTELYRVLKPGGKLVVLEFSKPKRFPIKQLFGFYFKYILPTIGRLVSSDDSAYTYLPASVQAFPEGAAFTDILIHSGFKTSQCIELSFGICSIYTGQK